jgi:hypothetical protein
MANQREQMQALTDEYQGLQTGEHHDPFPLTIRKPGCSSNPRRTVDPDLREAKARIPATGEHECAEGRVDRDLYEFEDDRLI